MRTINYEMKPIGAEFNNNNGKTYWVVYINSELDRTLLLDFQTKTYIGAWGIDYKNHCWNSGHYFMENFESAVNWVMGKEVI